MLKWVLALVASVMLFLSWGSENGFHFCIYVFLCPLFIAESFLVQSGFIKYALGLFFIVVFHLLAGIHLITDIDQSTIVLLLILNAFLLSIPWAIYIGVKQRLSLPISLLFLTILWLGVEQVSAETGIPSPWFVLGNGLMGRPEFIQFYEYTGVAGGSLWILSANCSLFYAINSFLHRKPLAYCVGRLAIFVGLLLLPILLSKEIKFISLASPQEVLIVNTRQTNETILKVTFNQLLERSRNNISEKTKYIIWPESIFESAVSIGDIGKFPVVREVRKHLIGDGPIILVCGLVFSEDYKYYNTALTISSENVNVYKKRQLVPFTEYHPSFFGLFKMFIWSDIEISNGEGAMIETNSVSVNICYESLFGRIVAENCLKSKGRVLAFISNEFWTPGASEFLLRICSIRAIENRKYILRSTNNGIASIIKPDGSVLKSSQSRESLSTIKTDIVPNDYRTFYMRYGDFIGRSALISLVVFPFLLFLGKFKAGNS